MWQHDVAAGFRFRHVYLNGRAVALHRLPIGSGGGEVVFTWLTDPQGSQLAAADGPAVLQTSEYEPYGKLLNRANNNRIGYTGHVMDAGTGLVQMQQRYYDPGIGAMLSVDPVAAYENPTTNFCRYCYARNNPYRFTDPDGRQSVGSSARYHEDYRPPPPQSPPVASDSSPVSSSNQTSQQQNDSGFSAQGLLVGTPSVEASGMAALGGGIQATKGLYSADSSVGIVTPALGLNASVDVNLLTLSYKGDSVSQAPVEVKMGFDVDAHAIFGGSVSVGYTPPSSFELSVDAGAGAGAGFKVFQVNSVFDEGR